MSRLSWKETLKVRGQHVGHFSFSFHLFPRLLVVCGYQASQELSSWSKVCTSHYEHLMTDNKLTTLKRYLTLPVVGDSLVLGSNVISGLEQLTKKYGSTVGLWMGPFRTVVMADFNDVKNSIVF